MKAMQQAGLLAANGHQVPEVDLSTKAKECVWCPILSALKKELEQTGSSFFFLNIFARSVRCT